MSLDDRVGILKSVGPKKAGLLAKLGIKTIRDLLFYIPRDYESGGVSAKIGNLTEGETYRVKAQIASQPVLKKVHNGLSLVTFSLWDDTGGVEAVFFNQPYMKKMYAKGDTVYVMGQIKRVGRRLQFTNPTIGKQDIHTEGPLPVYALTAGLTQKVMRMMIRSALDAHIGGLTDIFTSTFRADHNLAELGAALMNVHFPENSAALESAKRRLIFEELLLFNMALLSRESGREDGAAAFRCGADDLRQFVDKLGFVPTRAQLRVMTAIGQDLQKTKPMNRLLQGDVGSGKTAPAFYAMDLCVKNGLQCVMMAPTEVLARQHFLNAQRIWNGPDVRIELITGSTPVSQKKMVYENTAAGQTDIVIGTHAVLYDTLSFARLGLVITDEQHRFGTRQRALLETKSRAPHTLIMSATPIPRTLALILFGKTDISIIDEMPPGRSPVKTFSVPESKREDMYGFLEKEMDRGAQVFVVCPLIEQNEETDIRSSEEIYGELLERFSRFGVAQLHGRMAPAEKNAVMQRFKDRQDQLLVSTTVIEVGIDIPVATVMVIENAERFGLAQLHQLRGRVGRGEKQSYCFLMSGETARGRLQILTKTTDGFKIAEEDLKLRGPGQFLGSRQSGMTDLYMAHFIRDMQMLSETRDIAAQMMENDPDTFHALASQAELRFREKLSSTTIS